MAAEGRSLSLFVQEFDGLARPGELAGGGIPLPDGFAGDTGEMTLMDGSGEIRPAQFWAMGRWPSGCIQWLYVQTPVSLEAHKRLGMKLAAQEGAPVPEPRVRVTQDAGKIVLENRYVRVLLPTQRFGFPGGVSFDSEGKWNFSPGIMAVREARLLAEDSEGTAFSWGEDESVEAIVEEDGPLRAIVRLARGVRPPYAEQSLDLVVRVYLEGDCPALRIEMTYINTEGCGELEDLRDIQQKRLGLRRRPGNTDRPTRGIKRIGRLGYTVEIAGADGGVVFGGDGDVELIAKTAKAALVQDRVDRYWFDGSGGRCAGGWVGVPGAQGEVLLAGRDFREQFPKGIRWDREAGRATLEFWPPEAGPLDFYPGWAKTHEVLVGFPRDGAERAALLTGFRAPLRLCPTSDAYLESGAVDPFIEPDWARWPLFECAVGDSFAQAVAAQNFGEIDYGDRYIAEGERYHNGYHAPDQEWLIHYQRTGDERYFRLARPMVRHRMDIDVLHWPPEDAGRCHAEYNVNHWTPGRQIKAWIEGLAMYALMAGDRRVREVIAECGGWLARNPAFTNERASSIPVMALSHCYRVVNDPAYLETARRIVDHLYPLVMAGEYVRTPFMVGHLVDGLHWYWRHTGDGRAVEMVVRAGRWMHEVCIGLTGMPYYTGRTDARFPAERKAFRSQYWAQNRVYVWATGEVSTPSARACLLSGDRELLRFTTNVLDSWIRYYWGGGRGGYQGCALAVYALDSAGLTEADLAQAPPGVDVDEAVARVREYVADPPEEDNAAPGLLLELGRFLLNAGQAERGLEVLRELGAACLAGILTRSEEDEHLHERHDRDLALGTVYDQVEARLAAAVGQMDRAESTLLRLIGRYPGADPEDVLSPGHFRVAAACWQLAGLYARADRTDRADAYRKQARRYVGVHFV